MDSWDVNSIPDVELHGSSYEIGHTHGALLRRQIYSQLQIYADMFGKLCKFSWEQVREVATQYESTIQRLAPHLLEEMRGIADGVNGVTEASDSPATNGDHLNDGTTERRIDILDIIALNARSEIALGQWDDGCTSLAWNIGSLNDHHDDGTPEEVHEYGHQKCVLAQNWDWRTSVGPNLAIATIRQEGKPDIWMVTEAGIVGKIGFNSSSVGVCLNAIRAKPTDENLLPVHLILRLLLEQPHLSAAHSLIHSLGGCASSQHILLASTFGSRGLEISPISTVYLSEDKLGLVVHTNHFFENRLVDESPWLTGSPIRLERARTLCTELVKHYGKDAVREKLTPAVLRQKVFADTFNSPQAISCTPDPSRDESVETLFNIIMMFEEGEKPRAEVVFGRPTNSGAKIYHLPR